MERETLLHILQAGTMAPSGDNAQPWEFQIRGDSVALFNNHRLDHPHFNFRQRGTFLAHGALIENMAQAAAHVGFETSADLFPGTNRNHTATIRFVPRTGIPDTLFPYIAQRATNRKPYHRQPLTREQRTELARFSGCALLEDVRTIKGLGAALSVTERVALEIPSFHRFFFEHILWSAQEEREKIAGLYLKTMELPPPIRAIFRLMKHWPVNRFMNMLGFSKLAAAANARLYTQASALALFMIQDEQYDASFVEGGRVVQRFWLTLTKLGLYAQPITGALYLNMRLQAGESNEMDQKHAHLIASAYEHIMKAFGSPRGIAMMLFRIGYADPPSARSSRIPVNNLVIHTHP